VPEYLAGDCIFYLGAVLARGSRQNPEGPGGAALKDFSADIVAPQPSRILGNIPGASFDCRSLKAARDLNVGI
jgi:hypothetical protein